MKNIIEYTDICQYNETRYNNNTAIKVPVVLIENDTIISNFSYIFCHVELSFLNEYYENLEKVNSSATNFDDDNNVKYEIKLLKIIKILVITITVILIFSILMCVISLKCTENADNL